MSAKSEEMSAHKGRYWLWALRISVTACCLMYAIGFFSKDFFPLPLTAPFAGFYLLLFLGVLDTPRKGLLGLTRLISMVGILISFFLFALTQMGGPVFKLALPLFFSQWVVEVSAGKTTPR